MAAPFTFSFDVSADNSQQRADDRQQEPVYSDPSTCPGRVQPAKQHVLDLGDEFYKDFVCHVARCHPEIEHKSTAGLTYLKLDDLKQLCLQNACKFTFKFASCAHYVSKYVNMKVSSIFS